jgi:hypothetical protein
MRHFASPASWGAYKKLPKTVRKLADKNYALLKADPNHPSLHFKKVAATGQCGSAFVTGRLRPTLTAIWFGSGSDRMPIMML